MVTFLIMFIVLLVGLLITGSLYHQREVKRLTAPATQAAMVATVCILADRRGHEVSRRSFVDGREAPTVITRHSGGTLVHYDYVAVNDQGEHLYQMRKL